MQRIIKKVAEHFLVAQRAGHGGAAAAGQPLPDLHPAQILAGLARQLTPHGHALLDQLKPTAAAKNGLRKLPLGQAHRSGGGG